MPTDARPRYVQIAEQLRALGAGSDGKSEPPSVRKVAKQFNVSPVTASRALQYLGNPRGGDRDAKPGKTSERWAVCLHVSPGPHQLAAAQLTADGFRELAIEGRVSFDFDFFRSGSDGALRESPTIRMGAAIDQGVQGIFLLPSRISDEQMREDELLIAACKKANIPVVLIERNLRGDDRPLEQDLISFHDFEGGRLLTKLLYEKGRRRIAFLTGSPTSSHVERLAGYLSAVHSLGLKETLVLQHPSDATPAVAYGGLAEQLLQWNADSIICFHEYAALGLIMELLRLGKKVPRDFDAAAFYGFGLSESFSIGISTYSYPAKTVAARALDTMRWRVKNPNAPPIKVVAPGVLVERNGSN